MPPTPSLIPVTLLTGYLGSGKTSILNHIMQQSTMADTLVIINEFGEIALDHLLVVHSIDNVEMEMSSGCLYVALSKVILLKRYKISPVGSHIMENGSFIAL